MMNELLNNTAQFDFFKAIYLIENQLNNQMSFRRIGYDCDPRKELIRFASTQKFGYPGSAISKIEPMSQQYDLKKFKVDVSFMGLTGISGAMPQFYSELVLQRIKYKDNTMRDFFDMFNHRLISLYYRSWKKYKQSLNYGLGAKPNSDPHSKIISLLSGGGENHRLFFSGLFAKKIKNISDLKNILRSYLDCKVEVDQLVGQWKYLKEDEQTRLTSQAFFDGQYAQLGVNALLGSRIWDISTLIEINITPNSVDQFKRLFPNEPQYNFICHVIKDYVGVNMQFRVNVESQLGNPDIQRLTEKRVMLGGNSVLAFNSSKDKHYLRLSRKG